MNHARIRKSAAIAVGVATLGLGQLALSGGAFAADGSSSPKPFTSNSTGSTTSGCPVDWWHASELEYSPSTFKISDGLYFGVENTGTAALSNVKVTVKFTNIHATGATATGGKVDTWSASGGTASAASVAAKKRLVLNFSGYLTKGAHNQDVTVTVSGPGINCQPLQLTTTYDTTKPAPSTKPTTKPSDKPTVKPSSKPTTIPSSKPSAEPTKSAAPAPVPSSNGGGGKNLADTGASSNTPILIGGAGALVVVGGGLAFFAKRRRAPQA